MAEKKKRVTIVSLQKTIEAMQADIDELEIHLNKSECRETDIRNDVIKAHSVLDQLRKVYGDTLSWDNLVERAGGAAMHLQAQAPLMQAAESELTRMRERLAVLEEENERLKSCDVFAGGGIPVDGSCSSSCCDGHVPSDDRTRIDSLEDDLEVFRVVGRFVSRILWKRLA